MSEAISALAGVRYRGLVSVTEAGLRGMITLRGDLSSAALAGALRSVIGAAMPGQRRISTGDRGSVAWMSPDELLVMVDYADAAMSAQALQAALGAEFATVADVSDARAVFTLTGPQSRDVLAKICPVDFATFRAGEIRRTRAAQVAVAMWCSDQDEFTLVCFRSVAHYVWDLLTTVARPGGEVALYRS